MKHILQFSHKSIMTSSEVPRQWAGLKRGEFPPPDPSTRVELRIVSSRRAGRAHGGELIVAAGLGAVLISVCSKFVEWITLPSLSQMSVAGFGAVLAMLGVVKRRGVGTSPASTEATDSRPVEADLPSLTGQLSSLLSELRQQHGVAYRTRTWIETVLPAAGFDVDNPTLARDLLAAAALDAGGVRADVAKLAETYPREDIVMTSVSLIHAVQNVLAGCGRSTDARAPHPSDPSCWPAGSC